MNRRVGIVVLAVMLSGLVGPAVGAAAYPTEGDLEEARRAENAAGAAAADAERRLAALSERTDQLAEAAARAAETYNGARFALAEAAEAERAAARVAGRTARIAERARTELGRVAAATYRTGGQFAGLGLVLDANGTERFLHGAAALRAVTRSQGAVYQRAVAATEAAEEAATVAEQALADRQAAARDAERAAAVAAEEVTAHEALLAAAEQERAALMAELAAARGTTVALEEERQAGLDAAAAAEREQRARQQADAGVEAEPDLTTAADPTATDPTATDPTATDPAMPAGPATAATPAGTPASAPTGTVTSTPARSAPSAPPPTATQAPTASRSPSAEPTSSPAPPARAASPSPSSSSPSARSAAPPAKPSPTTATAPPPVNTSAAGRAIAYARAQLGKPYKWAGAGPDAFDCSGLTMRAWQQGGKLLPHWSVAQARVTTRVAYSNLRPGDLIFWSENGQVSGTYHVALYIGSGQMIHAPRPGKNVEVQSVFYWRTPSFYGRV